MKYDGSGLAVLRLGQRHGYPVTLFPATAPPLPNGRHLFRSFPSSPSSICPEAMGPRPQHPATALF